MRRVFITGVGVVSSIGLGRRAFFDALSRGQSGITPVESFDAAPLGRLFAGEIKDFRAEDHLTAAEVRRVGRCAAMSLAAMRMAIVDAGIAADEMRGPRTSVVVGTTMGEAAVIAELDHAWIAGGVRAMRRAMLPKYGSTLLADLTSRAPWVHKKACRYPHDARRVRRRKLFDRLRSGFDPRRSRRRRHRGRRRNSPRAPILRLRAPRRDAAAKMSADRSQPTRIDPRRRRGPSRSRIRKSMRCVATRACKRKSAATDFRATATTSRVRIPKRRAASRRCASRSITRASV